MGEWGRGDGLRSGLVGALHCTCAFDGARQLVGVLRVGGIARLLQGSGVVVGTGRALHGLGVARVLADQARVVAERFLVRVVSAELGLHFLCLAVDVFGGGDFGHLALPARPGFDAKQVEGVGATGASDLALAPAGFVPGLAQHVVRGNAAFLRHALCGSAVRLHKVVAPFGGGGIVVQHLGIGRCPQQARLARPLFKATAAVAQTHRRGNVKAATHAALHPAHRLLQPLQGLFFVDAHGARNLRRDRGRQPTGQTGHGDRQLLVVHIARQIAAAFFVHEAAFHGGLAHAFDHLAHEQRLKLLGRLTHGLRAFAVGFGLQTIERVEIGGQRIAGVVAQNLRTHITSSSAFKAPAALMACKIASRSWGVAPKAVSERTTSANWGDACTLMMLPGSWVTWMLLFSRTTVWPCDSGLGWLMTGVESMVMARLPWAMAQGPRVTAWFMTIEPVRGLITTLAAGLLPVSCSSSMSAIKPTRALGSIGARTSTVRPSRAAAVPMPWRLLMACTTLVAVWKSKAFSPRRMVSLSLSGVGTARSTCAPIGMRPALRWLICTLEPPCEAPAPPTTILPWARA